MSMKWREGSSFGWRKARSATMNEIRCTRRCVELKHPVDDGNIDTTSNNISANQQSGGFKASELVKDFVAGRFQVSVNTHHNNSRRQRTARIESAVNKLLKTTCSFPSYCFRMTAAQVDMLMIKLFWFAG